MRKTYLAAGLIGLAALAGCASQHPAAHTPAAKPAPAVTITQSVPGPTVTVTQTPVAQPGQVLLKHSGSGNWNSDPFQVSSDSPQLRVTYTYSGNGSDGSPDNFSADIENGTDDQLVANDISWSGGKTTNIYPDPSLSNSTSYHLSVSATGSWSFTVTEVS